MLVLPQTTFNRISKGPNVTLVIKTEPKINIWQHHYPFFFSLVYNDTKNQFICLFIYLPNYSQVDNCVCCLLYCKNIPLRLINQEGSLLSYAGSGDKDAKVTAAIASSIWAAYEKNGKMAFHSDELKMIFMDCEVCICSLYLIPTSLFMNTF